MAFENTDIAGPVYEDPNETEEDRRRAIEDAVKEWEAEGGSLEPQESAPILGQRWIGCFYVCDCEGDIIQGMVKQDCKSYEEAVGLTYIEVEEKYPQEEGFTAPRIVIDDEPIFKVAALPNDIQLIDPA